MPAVTPVKIPVDELIVAIEISLLLHAPPVVISFRTVVRPVHTVSVPVIDAGKGLTVTIVVPIHPVARVYVILLVPAIIPFTTPLEEPIVAMDILLLLHTPPFVVSIMPVVRPEHTVAVPEIRAGKGLMVITISI